MGKLIIEISDYSFDKNLASSYQLSVLIGTDSFVYAVTSSEGKLLLLKEFALDKQTANASGLDELLMREAPLRATYGAVKVAHINQYATLVPIRLFNPDQLPDYFKQLIGEKGDLHFESLRLSGWPFHLLFAVEPDIWNWAQTNLKPTRNYHLAHPFIQTALDQVGENGVVAMSAGDRLLVAAVANRNLQFFNIFHFTNVRDFLYYILLSYHQAGLSPESCRLLLSGKVDLESEMTKTIARYVADIKTVAPPAGIHFGSSWNGHRPHYFAALIQLAMLTHS